MRYLIGFLLSLPAFGLTCANTTADRTTIQNAVNAGGTVTLTGTCNLSAGSVNVNNAVTINGSATIAQSGNIVSFTVNSNNVSISGLTFSGAGQAVWLTVSGAANNPRQYFTFTNNTIQNTNGNNGIVSDAIARYFTISNNRFLNFMPSGASTTNCNSWSGGCDNTTGAGIVILNGVDNSTIEYNLFTLLPNDAIHLGWNLITQSRYFFQTKNVSISYNEFSQVHRIGIETQGNTSYVACTNGSGDPATNTPGVPANCTNNAIVNTINSKVAGNYFHDPFLSFYNTFAFSVVDGWSANYINNAGILNNVANSTQPGGNGAAYAFEIAGGDKVFQGNVAVADSMTPFGNPKGWGSLNSLGGTNGSYRTWSFQNNVYATDQEASHNFGADCAGYCPSPTLIFVQQYNYRANASPNAGQLTTSAIAPLYVSANTSGTVSTFNWSVVSTLPIRNVQYFLDGSGTAFAAQEIGDISTTFASDLKWRYHSNVDTSSLTGGTHTVQATFTDVSGAVSSVSQNFTVAGGSSPAVSLSPTSITFGSVLVGSSSAPSTVILTNTGNAALNISSITITGANAGDFSKTTTCGSTLAAAASCNIVATFTPTAAGSRSAIISVADNAAASPQTVALSGVSSTCASILANCNFSTGSLAPWQFAAPGTTAAVVDTSGPSGETAAHVTVAGLSGAPGTYNIELYQNNLTFVSGYAYSMSIKINASRSQKLNMLGILNGSPWTTYLSSPFQPTVTAGSWTTYVTSFTVINAPAAGTARFTIQMNDAQNGDELEYTDIAIQQVTSPALTISNLTLSNVDHASANISFRCSGPCYPYVKYGTSSGLYDYTSASWPALYNAYTQHYDVTMQLSGLAPSTTFYALATIRPNADDDAGVCSVSSCGATELSFTTLPIPAIHPAPPIAPAEYKPAEPDTSAYTAIPMTVNGTTGECVAALNVTAPSGGGWVGNVTAGDSFQTIFAEIGYRSKIQIPQGAHCKVLEQNPFNHIGYLMAALPLDPNAGGNIDSPNHGWIVVETVPAQASDFPPFGVQITPEWSSKLAKLIVQTPASPTDGHNPGYAQNLSGQIFACGSARCHHFWFRNLEWTHLADSTVYPGNVADPPAFGPYFQVQPFDGSRADSTTPDYMVVDRVYMHGQPWPSRETALVVWGGDHHAILNSYMQANMWWPAVYPTVDPTYSGATISVPTSYFQYNAFDGNPVGMTAPATATFNGSGVGTYTGMFIGWLSTSGLTVAYQTTSGVTLTCSGCTPLPLSQPSTGASYRISSSITRASNIVSFATDPATYAGAGATVVISGASDSSFNGSCTNLIVSSTTSFSCTQTGANATTTGGYMYVTPSYPASAMLYFYGHFNGSGTAVPDYSVPQQTIPGRAFTSWRPLGIYWEGGNFGNISNNYIEAIGQTLYNDPYNQQNDNIIRRNFFEFPRSKMKNSGQWDGYKYTYRNVVESKMSQRVDFSGNVVDGSAAYQNAGNPLFLTSPGLGPADALGGVWDWKVHNNIFQHLSSGLDCANGGSSYPPDLGTIRIEWSNNILFDLNRFLYNDGGSGFFSGPFASYSGCEDLNITHNTVMLATGNGPALLLTGSPDGGTTNHGEGLSVTENILTMSLTNQTDEDVIYSICGQQTLSHPAYPADVCGGLVVPNYPAMLNGSFIQTDANGVTPSWVFDHNVIIGGVNTGAAPAYTDLTQAQIDTVASTFPSGNTFVAGDTLASRFASMKWFNYNATVQSPDFHLRDDSPFAAGNNPYGKDSDAGVNILQLQAAQGFVTLTGVPATTITSNAATIAYVAPDGDNCYVDYATEPTVMVSPVRVADSGGARPRNVALTGLTSHTTYYYRVMCSGNVQSSQRTGQFRTN